MSAKDFPETRSSDVHLLLKDNVRTDTSMAEVVNSIDAAYVRPAPRFDYCQSGSVRGSGSRIDIQVLLASNGSTAAAAMALFVVSTRQLDRCLVLDHKNPDAWMCTGVIGAHATPTCARIMNNRRSLSAPWHRCR